MPRVVGVLVYCLVLFGTAWLIGARTPEKRRRDGDEWARSHLAYVESGWTADVDRCLAHNRRVELYGMGFFGLALWSVPRSLGAYVACLAVVPALVAIAKGYTATRPDYLPPGPRVARLRELSLSDYLSLRYRAAMWASVVLASGVAVVTALRTHWWVALASVVLVAAAAAVEVTGAWFARMPEPAGDAAHLYWQDAMRADVLRSAASFVPASAALMCVAMIGFEDTLHRVLGFVVMGVLVAPLFVLERRSKAEPAADMRSRLWPGLAPGQVVQPGEPVSSWGATS